MSKDVWAITLVGIFTMLAIAVAAMILGNVAKMFGGWM